MRSLLRPALTSIFVALIMSWALLGQAQAVPAPAVGNATYLPMVVNPPVATPAPTNTPTSAPLSAPTNTPTGVPLPTAPPTQHRIGAICRDGTRSTATGSGACSHHGGVAYWLYRP